MCYSFLHDVHVAVNVCINCSFVHLCTVLISNQNRGIAVWVIRTASADTPDRQPYVYTPYGMAVKKDRSYIRPDVRPVVWPVRTASGYRA